MGVVVNLDDGRDGKASLDPLIALVKTDLEAVNELIFHKMKSPVPLIPQLLSHVVAAGGKRLRPMLTLAAAKLCGYSGGRQIVLAACIEFIHTATLLHDDVVDESDLRRGNPSANSVWGNKATVLVGDFLFSRTFEWMVEDGSLGVLAILSNTTATISEGEVMQLVTANDTKTGEGAYLDVVKNKTAKLFSAACQIGAVVAERPKEEEAALETFGTNLGIAFQLIDDALDYSSKEATLGKEIGDDFRDGKITLPVILAFHRGNEEERDFWRRTMEDQEFEDGDLERAIQLMEKHNAMADTAERARHYGAMARDALGIFPGGPEKNALINLVDFCIERAY
jgi:octaprenyl-diphosphate synthase